MRLPLNTCLIYRKNKRKSLQLLFKEVSLTLRYSWKFSTGKTQKFVFLRVLPTSNRIFWKFFVNEKTSQIGV